VIVKRDALAGLARRAGWLAAGWLAGWPYVAAQINRKYPVEWLSNGRPTFMDAVRSDVFIVTCRHLFGSAGVLDRRP